MSQDCLFRASHLSQIVSLTLLWLFFLVVLLYSFYEPTQLKLTLLFGGLVFLLTAWNRSLKIVLDESGILYKSGWKTRSLSWTDIGSIDMELETTGTTFSKNVIIRSNNVTKMEISFNVFYFRQKDITLLGQIIRDRLPDLPMDEDFSKRMKNI